MTATAMATARAAAAARHCAQHSAEVMSLAALAAPFICCVDRLREHIDLLS